MGTAQAEQTVTRQTFADYAEEWMLHRELKDHTRDHYRRLLDDHLLSCRQGRGSTRWRGCATRWLSCEFIYDHNEQR
ncbi:hypothetical protein JMUB5695_03063 [Mycobacterium heckeshornense]|nr:hypothetical protein JMUB5695_03063 [Mycobacterium heckeshornense]